MKVLGAVRSFGLALFALPLFLPFGRSADVNNGTVLPTNIDFDTVVTGRLVQLQIGLSPPRSLQVYRVSAKSIRGRSQSASDFLHVNFTAYDSHDRTLITTSNTEHSWLQWTAPVVKMAPRDVLSWSWYRQRMSLSSALSVLHGTDVEDRWSGITISRLPEAVIGQQRQAFYGFFRETAPQHWRLGAADGHIYWLWANTTPLNDTGSLSSLDTDEATS